jgi:GNAT superfamily N-acetyltransferase
MITIRAARFPEDIALVQALLREYADDLGDHLTVGQYARELTLLADEVTTLPGRYAEPRGVLMLAADHDVPMGLVGLRPINEHDCELKRLYVRPEARGHGLGKWLVIALLDRARRLRYQRVMLDTLPSMEAANRLYDGLGFVETAAYGDHQVEGARYLILALRGGTPRPFPGLKI